MSLDLQTLIVAAISVRALTSVIVFLAWLADKSTNTLLWMVLGSVMAIAGVLFRVALPEDAAIVVGNIFMLGALGSLSAASRALDRSPCVWWPFGLPALLWVAACSYPPFRHDLDARVALSSALSVLPVASAIWELWKGRSDRLLSRWIAIIQLVLCLAYFVTRFSVALVADVMLSPQATTPSDFALLALLSLGFSVSINYTIMMLTKERAAQQHRADAETDALTGLPNRRSLTKILDNVSAQAKRTGSSLAVIMIDVDRFKPFNDLYGHVAGDACLGKIASALFADLRGSDDLVFRYGGEEFVVVLPDANWQDVELVAQRLRLGIHKLALVHGKSETGRVTISLGYAVGDPAGGDTPDDFLRAADRALYNAKAAGRDRICSAETRPGVRKLRTA